jgi:hypothetical protein
MTLSIFLARHFHVVSNSEPLNYVCKFQLCLTVQLQTKNNFKCLYIMTHGPSSATVDYPKPGRTRAYIWERRENPSYKFDSKFNVLSLYSRLSIST